jgi:hypothetical protein
MMNKVHQYLNRPFINIVKSTVLFLQELIPKVERPIAPGATPADLRQQVTFIYCDDIVATCSGQHLRSIQNGFKTGCEPSRFQGDESNMLPAA